MPVRKPRKITRAAETKRSVKNGQAQAAEVLALRKKDRKARSAALKKNMPRNAKALTLVPVVSPNVLKRLGSSASMGVLIAEGDSWFDYPLNNVLKMLEDEHAYDVESVARNGDRVEDMAYSLGQLDEFSRRLEKVLRKGDMPKAILLSGGGNDMAGRQFEMLLNHAASPIAGLNDKIVTGVIDDRIRNAYVHIITAITAVAQDILKHPLPILTHGYDYPVPDGRGFMGGFSALPGPWLEPGFRLKGYKDREANTRTMRKLIDRFNDMLKATSASPGFGHVTFVELRGTLSSASHNYKTDWANELHPKPNGFGLIADKFAKTLASL